MQEWKSQESNADGAPHRQIPDLIWKTLSSRGIRTPEQIEKFYSPKLKDLRDPMSLTDMGKAVERLLVAFKEQQSLCIYGDFDLDGTSGLALLKDGFEGLGFANIQTYQPSRLSEGYGVHVEAVEKIAQSCQLMVTVDVGITANEAVARASELGMDVIVTDHHQPGEELPNAVAVVNPNRGNCPSGLGHLSGVGVGFFLFLAVRRALRDQGLGQAFDPKILLDYFVIGTLTDLVPVIDENRVLVKHGLLQLEKTMRPGLRGLLKELGMLGRPLNSQDVAIRFAPKINALSRMEKNIRPLDLFLVQSEDEAKSLVKEVMACNEERIAKQSFAESQAEVLHRESGNESFAWVHSSEFHRGVVGLVATKMALNLGVPAFIGAEGDDGTIVGSARLPGDSNLNLLEALEAASEALVKFGGHKAAAGFELEKSQVGLFREKLEAFWVKALGEPLPTVLNYDGIGRLPEISPVFMKWYEGMGPFGSQFSIPVYLFSEAQVSRVKTLRGGHLKFWIHQFEGGEKEALWFSPEPDHPFAREEKLKGALLDVLAEPQWNYFAGRKTIQLLVKGIREAKKQ